MCPTIMRRKLGPEEETGLAILRDVQAIFQAVIASQRGNGVEGELYYATQVAVFVGDTAEGFLALREMELVDASKLLVRPMIEAVFKAKAVMAKEGFLFRVTFKEWSEE